MKRVIAAGLVMLLLMFMLTASASSPGSSTDPLITRSYLHGAFNDSLRAEIGHKLGGAADRAIGALDAVYASRTGYSFAPRFTNISLTEGATITISMGSGFILLSGLATITVTGGSVINISTGDEVPSGTRLTPNQRYFGAENTTAVITANSPATGQVDGYYKAEGISPTHDIFRDVLLSDWFFSAVDYVYKNGLFQGTGDDAFSPGMSMSRAMFVTVLHRLDGMPPYRSSGDFSDVRDTGSYYYNAVMWASENGIVMGYDDGTFQPNRNVSREQMAVFMHRYAGHKGHATSSGSAYGSFPDAGDVSGYAAEAMRWAVSRGVISGSDGRLLPLSTATRAQVAQIFLNYSVNIGI